MTDARRVLHLVHTWGLPSHTFVRAAVSGVPGVAPVVVCERRAGTVDPGIPVHELAWADRLPHQVAGKARVLATATLGRHAALVHAHFGHELLLADRVAQVLRRPWVASLHGHDALVELPSPAHGAARRALTHAAAVIVPSPFLGTRVEHLGVPTERVVVAPSGVDLDELPFAPRTRRHHEATRVLFIGRFVEKKGVLATAEALVRASSQVPLEAAFVGSGPLEPALREALTPLAQRARVVDGVDRRRVLAELAHAHLLLSPSRTAPDGDAETLLVVNLEAQACGIPVLTTRHGGIPTAVAPDAAVLVDEGDDAGLVTALVQLASTPERWPAMGTAGRRFVEAGFTQERAAQRLAALYAELRH